MWAKSGELPNFSAMLENIFMPLFEVSRDPAVDPNLDAFLKHVVGFDSVDDESKIDARSFNVHSPTPDKWVKANNPPYSYYIYYFFANMSILNQVSGVRRGAFLARTEWAGGHSLVFAVGVPVPRRPRPQHVCLPPALRRSRQRGQPRCVASSIPSAPLCPWQLPRH